MELHERKVEDVTVLTIAGSIDALTAPKIAVFIDDLITRGETNLVADLAGVDYTSSAGLRVLLGAIKGTRAQSGDMRLASVQPDVMKVLKLSGFTNILKVFDDVGSAVSSFL